MNAKTGKIIIQEIAVSGKIRKTLLPQSTNRLKAQANSRKEEKRSLSLN